MDECRKIERWRAAKVSPDEMARDPVLLFIDLDRFKAVNDVHGHLIGDKVLCEVAKRLETVIPRTAISMARLGGDEFAVLFSSEGDPEAGTAIEQRVVDALSRSIMVNDLQMQIGASCGVADLLP